MDNDQIIYDTVKKEYWYFLQISCIFLNYQPKWKLLSRIQLAAYFIVTVYHIILFANTVVLSLENNDLDTAAQSIHFLTLAVLVFVILVNINILRESVVVLINNKAAKYYSYGDSTTTVLQDKLNKETKKLKVLTLAAIPLYTAFIAAAWIIIVPLADRYQDQKKTYENGIYMETPFRMWFPYLIDNNFKYIISLAFQASIAFIFASTMSAADLVMIFVAIDLITQLKVLNHSIETIEERAQTLYEQNGGKFKENKVKSIKENEIYYNAVNYCIKQNVEHHKVINQSFTALGKIGNWPFMVAYLAASIVVALSLYTGVSGGTRLAPQLLSLLLLFAEICNIFILCWLGQQMSDQSGNLFQQFYNVNWLHWNQSCKLSLLIARERYKKTMIMKAGSIIALNFSTFSDIMSSAYSYFQLLYALKKEQ